jgi:hypothetical protein
MQTYTDVQSSREYHLLCDPGSTPPSPVYQVQLHKLFDFPAREPQTLVANILFFGRAIRKIFEILFLSRDRITQPDKTCVRLVVDISHPRDLVVFLIIARLVDAQRIYPKPCGLMALMG